MFDRVGVRGTAAARLVVMMLALVASGATTPVFASTGCDALNSLGSVTGTVVVGGSFNAGDIISEMGYTGPVDPVFSFSGTNSGNGDTISASAGFGDLFTISATIPSTGHWSITFINGLHNLSCTSSTQAPSTVNLSASSSTTLIGQPVTLKATLSPLAASGTVSFRDGTTPVCSSVPVTAGSATCAAKFTSAGAHSLTASYSGDTSYLAATSAAVTVTVTDQTGTTVGAISRFLGARNNQILSNEPDSSRQIDRLDGSSGATGAGTGAGFVRGNVPAFGPAGSYALGAFGSGFHGGDVSSFNSPRLHGQSQMESLGLGASSQAGAGGDGSPLRLGFSTSLASILRQSAAEEQQLMDSLGIAPSGTRRRQTASNPFDVWVEGKYADFRDNRGSSDLEGDFGTLALGADYVFNRSLLAGVMVQFDSMRLNSGTQLSEVRGNGWMVGPYATVRLSDHIFWQGRAAWGRSSNVVSPFASYSDNFDTTRWLVSSKLTGIWRFGSWGFRPSASIAYMEDASHAYLDSFGMEIPDIRSTLGLAKIGPEIGYTLEPSKGVLVEPFAGVHLMWNFTGATTASGIIGGEEAGPAGVRGRLEVGVRASTTGGVKLDVSGSYDGLGTSDYSSVTGRAMVRVPF